MVKNKVTATAQSVKDINGKEQLYVVLEGKVGERYAINVGAKTFKTLVDMQTQLDLFNESEGDEMELPDEDNVYR